LGYWLDILVLLFPIINYLYLNKKTANGGGISFIEWWTDKVIYKTRKDNENQIILNSDIKSTSIRLDDIIISIVNGTTFIINLADFTDYKQRLAIKANFEKLSNEVKTI
jgi:hypothetical protein